MIAVVAIQTRWVRKAQWVVQDVGIAVPGLGVSGIHRVQPRGVGRNSAALGLAILAIQEIVEGADSIRILAGEGRVRCAGDCVLLAERGVGGY